MEQVGRIYTVNHLKTNSYHACFFHFRSPSQRSNALNLEAGRYYFVLALQKGTSSSDSLSAGVQLPSGRFIRPLTKETIQWRRPGCILSFEILRFFRFSYVSFMTCKVFLFFITLRRVLFYKAA